MNPANFAYVTIIMIFSFISAASSIRCFQCSSYVNPECANVQANDIKSPFLQKCESRGDQQMFCRKTVQTVLDAPKFTRITRSCGWYLYKTNTSNCLTRDTDFKLEQSCQCFTEGCNGGPRSTALTPTIISSIAVIVYIHRLLPL